ncbi:MAG: hypothetical protein KDE28_30705, partial [Anaerolineales bacterium]|nr:hypothetical protein [Anaerolineales bacterium]
HVSSYLLNLKDLVFPESKAPKLETWGEWLAYAAQNPNVADLRAGVEVLLTTQPRAVWTTETMRAGHLHLLELLTSDWFLAFPAAYTVVSALATQIVMDVAFPEESQTHIEFYVAILTGMCQLARPNTTDTTLIIRLADAILRGNPAQAMDVLSFLQEWFERPIPLLAPLVLESFEVLAESGLEGWRLQPLFQKWLVALLDQPMAQTRTDLGLWLSFGPWMNSAPELLTKAEEILQRQAEDETDNPIARLPARFLIVIFMLRKSTADRVRLALLDRNPELDVRICLEKAMNDQVASLARNADMAVVVTTCITHAITYGIEPLLTNEPIYPQSSGSTSILGKIEDASRAS